MSTILVIGPHPGGIFNDATLARGLLQSLESLPDRKIRYRYLETEIPVSSSHDVAPLEGDKDFAEVSQVLVILTPDSLDRINFSLERRLANLDEQVPVFLFLLPGSQFIEPSLIGMLDKFHLIMVQDEVCKAALLQAVALYLDPPPQLYAALRGVQVVSVGTDTDLWTPPNPKEMDPSKAEIRNLLWAGSVAADDLLLLMVENYKKTSLNVAQALHVLSALKRRHPKLKPKLCLHTPGLNESEFGSLRTLASGNDIEVGTDLIVQRDLISLKALRHLYHAADLYLNVKIQGALDFSTMEAMACGLPCACTDDFIRSKYTENNLGIPLEAVNFESIIKDQTISYARKISPCTAADKIAEGVVPEKMQKFVLNTRAWAKDPKNDISYATKEVVRLMGLV